MQFRRRNRRRAVINITSLIDILFLLIIFFVVSSTFLEQPGLRLSLPAAESAEPAEVRELVVDMDSAGQLRLDGDPLSIDALPAALSRKIADETTANNDRGRVLVIRADRSAEHGRVVEVMDAARRAGVEDLVIATAVAAPADGAGKGERDGKGERQREGGGEAGR